MAQLEQEELERFQRDVLKNSSYSYEDDTINYDEFQGKLIVLMDLVRSCIDDFQRTPLNGSETHTTDLQLVTLIDVVSYDHSGLELEANDEQQSDEELVVSALLDSTEIQRDDDICISVEVESIDNNQHAQPFTVNLEEKVAEPYAHKLFDEMTESIQAALLEEQLHTKMAHIHTKLDLHLDGTLGDVMMIEMQKATGPYAYHILDEMTPTFRAKLMNDQLMDPYIRGINVHNITLFDPGGDRKYAMSSSAGVVPKVFGKAHGTWDNGLEGVDWAKTIMKKVVDRVLEGMPHSNSIGIQGAKDVLDENVNVVFDALGLVDDRNRLVLLVKSILQGDKSQVDVLEDSARNVFDELVINPTYLKLTEEYHDIETAVTEKVEKALKVECLRVSGNLFDELLSTMFLFDPGISSQLDEMFQSLQDAQLKKHVGVTSSLRHANLFSNTSHMNSRQALFHDMDKCTAAMVILRVLKSLEGAIIHMFVIIHPKDDVPVGLPIQMIPFEIAGRILHAVSTLLSSNGSGYQIADILSSLHLLDGFKHSQCGAKRCNNTENSNDNMLNETGVPIVTLVDHFSELFGSNVMNIGLDMCRPKHFWLGSLLSGSKQFAQHMLANDNDNVAIATLEDFIWDQGPIVTSFDILEDKDGFKGVGKEILAIVIVRRRYDLTYGKLAYTYYYGALVNLKWYEQRKLQGAENGKLQHDVAFRMWPQLRNEDFRCLMFGAQLWIMSCVKLMEHLLFKHGNVIMVFIFHPG